MVVYLDEKTTLLDEAIAKKRIQIDLLSEHRTALINNAITKGLDPNAEMKDSGVEWIGKMPKGWEIRRIKTFSQVKR
jgi:type I restriction enzyme S subunit